MTENLSAEDQMMLQSLYWWDIPSLFRCPDGYIFQDSVRRCVKESEAAEACDKTPDVSRIRLEPKPVQLRVQDLEDFFRKYRRFLPREHEQQIRFS